MENGNVMQMHKHVNYYAFHIITNTRYVLLSVLREIVKGGKRRFVKDALPQVLKHQMEKQLNHVQGNTTDIRTSPKIFIKILHKIRLKV